MAEDTANGRLLARLDERVKALDLKLDLYHEDVCTKVQDHEERIRRQESQTWFRTGIAAITGAVGGFVAGLVK